jgi:membrane protease YdiL (CAAX protease family)
VLLSTTLYAGAAVAVAARLFGQEAVLFADSGSVKTLFQRRFFKPALRPTAAQAFLLLALTVLAELLRPAAAPPHPWRHRHALDVARHRRHHGHALRARAGLMELHPLATILFLALVPAVCEELFFRGYALSGLRTGVGRITGLVIVAIAFGVYHHSVHRLAVTTGLGLLFGLLVLQYRSVWPAILAHLLHNGLAVTTVHEDVLKPFIVRAGYNIGTDPPPVTWVLAAGTLTLVGILLCVFAPDRRKPMEKSALLGQDDSVSQPSLP